MEDSSEIKDIVDDATFDYTMGESDAAIEKLNDLLGKEPQAFSGWLALAEIYYSEKRYEDARDAAEKAHALNPNDVFINTSLSRIWLELGSKEKAEHFGAQAKVASWKDQLQNPEENDPNANLAS